MSNTPSSAYERRSYRYYVLGLLTLVYTVNFVDRQLLSILQEAIKVDLGLNDEQLGRLSLAFAVFYVVAGLPIATLADRSNRRTVITVAISAWSLMTMACGYAANFLQLSLARIGVGVGEAGCSPPAHSIISDVFPKEKRAVAFSVYSLGVNFGVFLGLVLGGVLNEVYGWRVAFVVVGAPGLLLALIVRFTIKEPTRGWADGQVVDKLAKSSVWQVVKFTASKDYLVHLSVASGLSAFGNYAVVNWAGSYFVRVHGMGTAELSLWLGVGIALFGGIGTFGTGWLCDKLGRRKVGLYMWVPAVSLLLSIPFVVVAYFSRDTQTALIAHAVLPIFTVGYLGASLAVLHSSVPNHMRATSSAILFLVINVIGMACGPYFVGLLSNYLNLSTQLGVESLPRAILILVPISCIWASIHFFIAGQKMSKGELGK